MCNAEAAPTAFDRLLASRMGAFAAKTLFQHCKAEFEVQVLGLRGQV